MALIKYLTTYFGTKDPEDSLEIYESAAKAKKWFGSEVYMFVFAFDSASDCFN